MTSTPKDTQELRTDDVRHVVLTPDMTGWRLDRALATVIPTLSRSKLKSLVSAGHVESEGKLLRDPALKVIGNEALAVVIPEPRPDHHLPEDIPLSILFEDEHLLIVDKQAGLVVHPGAGNLEGTLVNALLHHCKGRLSGMGGVARPGIVHRIDKDTTGLLIVAKTDPAHEGLAAQFRRQSVGRHYLAVVAGQPAPPAGIVETYLARSATNRQKVAVVPEDQGRHAVTRYRVLSTIGKASLVECRLETGRTHQVRVHMAHIGHPLVGDPVYGMGRLRDVTKRIGFSRQALHAVRLMFTHPITGEDLEFSSPLPKDIQALLTELGL